MKILQESELVRLEHYSRMDRIGLMIKLIARMGLRQAEAVELRVRDYDPDDFTLLIEGPYQRLIAVPEEVRFPLARQIHGRAMDAFIVSSRQEGVRKPGQRSFQGYLKRLAARHGFNDLSVNNLRATFIVRQLESGIDPGLLQKYMGIRSRKSILKYRSLVERPDSTACFMGDGARVLSPGILKAECRRERASRTRLPSNLSSNLFSKPKGNA